MSTPAPRHVDDDRPGEEHGWPQAHPRQAPIRSAPPPRRGRSPRDFTWLALAALGLALGAAAVVWYLSLNRSSPPSRLTVPPVVGMREGAAVKRLTTEGFNVRAIERPGDAKAGRVFAQRPAPLSTLARGATVTLSVADGRKP